MACLRLGVLPLFSTYTSLSRVSPSISPQLLCSFYSTTRKLKKHKQIEAPKSSPATTKANDKPPEDIPMEEEEEDELEVRRKTTVERRAMKFGEKVSQKKITKDKSKKALALEKERENRYLNHLNDFN